MRYPRILFASTYPPTTCGLATYTQAMIEAVADVRGSATDLGVVRLHSASDTGTSIAPIVAGESCVNSDRWPEEVSLISRDFDVLWLQHEFGIFGPDDGSRVLDLCEATPAPIVTTLHTVLSRPTRRQRTIVEALAARSAKLVVMSEAARLRLIDGTRVHPEKILVIPHGAHGYPRVANRHCYPRPTIVTWGLVGPGKGIEWGIQAMARLRHLRPLPHYVVHGSTHPNVLRTQGEVYRIGLGALADELGVADMVSFNDRYLTPAQLADLVGSADMALLAYDSTEQVTSGVLVEAVGAGLPVIASPFPHAVEILAHGAGRVIPHRDPEAIARAIEGYVTRPGSLQASAWAARRSAPDLSWQSVALRSDQVASRAAAAATAGVA
ncbi:glycosyltransferase [soil metagenome]